MPFKVVANQLMNVESPKVFLIQMHRRRQVSIEFIRLLMIEFVVFQIISASFWFQLFIAVQNGSLLTAIKAESTNSLIEIIDLDDENDTKTDINNIGSNASIGNGTDNTSVEITSKDKPNALAKIQAEDATSVSFDPKQSIAKSDEGNNRIAPSSMERERGNAQQTRPSIDDQKKIKVFNCKRCKYGTNIKGNFESHKKIHAQEKMMGLKRDQEDGFLHCTLCALKFKQLKGYCTHMKKHHNG